MVIDKCVFCSKISSLFINELELNDYCGMMFLNSLPLQVISEIIETCRAHDFTDVVLVHEHRGVPDGIIISHLPFGPTAYFGLLNVVSSLIPYGVFSTFSLS